MTPAYAAKHILPAALALLPPRMDTPEARAMLIAIGLQESKFQHRRQVQGPARGYWQFEQGGGVAGVVTHPASNGYALAACDMLDYSPVVSVVYPALADNDILACAFARLLLWTLPGALPTITQPDKGWAQYIAAWRPGRPHVETWIGCWARAWGVVQTGDDVQL
jgi:hypothetical protein